ncbi:MAG: esterase family protein [Terrimonas sp.]|nr:esterase family protein [Terrimonas sp.]
MKKMLLAGLGIVMYTAELLAAQVDTVVIHSDAMKKDFNCYVVLPDNYQGGDKHYPVVYLLHGYSGNSSDWLNKDPDLKKEADNNNLIIVCPEGGYSSWYFDSPVDTSMKYETYIGKEVPVFIDRHYRTLPNRNGRAITGLSMGGHGGMFIGLRHPDMFGACGSMSGGVDINCCVDRFDVALRIGDTAQHADNWKSFSVMNLVEQYNRQLPLSIIIDCGTEDFFYSINHQLHEKMLKLKILHDYTERPGAHNWAYWTNAVKYQLLFFSEYFKH